MNLLEWEVGIPGKAGVRISSYCNPWRVLLNAWPQTPWEGGVYKLMMIFPEGDSTERFYMWISS